MSKTQVRIINGCRPRFTKAISKSLRQSPKCNEDFEFQVVPHIIEPNFLYIDIVDQEYDRPWNVHCVLTTDSPREICYKLIKFCPDLFCLDYADFPQTQFLVCGGYKSATSTVANTFGCHKTHHVDFTNAMLSHTDTILVPFNPNQHKVNMSGYFQCLCAPWYEHSYYHNLNVPKNRLCGKACGADCGCQFEAERRYGILKYTTRNDLVKHYNSIDFSKYLHFNNKERARLMGRQHKVKLTTKPKTLECHKIQINGRTIKLIYFDIWHLNHNFENLKTQIFGKPRPNLRLRNFNIGKEKWYRDIYGDFLKRMS